jgi:hypothetical protein
MSLETALLRRRNRIFFPCWSRIEIYKNILFTLYSTGKGSQPKPHHLPDPKPHEEDAASVNTAKHSAIYLV